LLVLVLVLVLPVLVLPVLVLPVLVLPVLVLLVLGLVLVLVLVLLLSVARCTCALWWRSEQKLLALLLARAQFPTTSQTAASDTPRRHAPAKQMRRPRSCPPPPPPASQLANCRPTNLRPFCAHCGCSQALPLIVSHSRTHTHFLSTLSHMSLSLMQ
jgi:hypothetical protein